MRILRKTNLLGYIQLSIIAFLITISVNAVAPTISGNYNTSTLDIADIPDYTGAPFVELRDNIPDFYLWQLKPTTFIVFSSFDEQGRTGAGMACLSKETLPTAARSEIGNIRPSGWHDEIEIVTTITEEDSDGDDIGTKKTTRKISAKDISNGFSISQTITVKENTGKRKGNTAKWTVKYEFSKVY